MKHFFYFVSKLLKVSINSTIGSLEFHIISLGFILLTVGILLGVVCASETWGSYWNWDSKETWAFTNWSIFAIYLHIRTNTIFAIVTSLAFL